MSLGQLLINHLNKFFVLLLLEKKKKNVNVRNKLEDENSRQWNGYLGCVKFGMCKVCMGNVYP